MSTIYLFALDDRTGKSAKVIRTDDFDKDVKRLFKKIYGKEFGGVKCFACVPGQDIAALYQGSPSRGSYQEYLSLSYSDHRIFMPREDFLAASI